MQEFSTKEVRHSFKIDGHEYWLNGVTVDDIEAIAALAELDETAQLTQFRDIIVGRANPRRRTAAQWFARVPSVRKSVRALTISQLSQLFVAWSGFGKKATPGESSALPDSAPTSDKN